MTTSTRSNGWRPPSGADLLVGVGENLSANRSIAELEREGHAVVRRAS